MSCFDFVIEIYNRLKGDSPTTVKEKGTRKNLIQQDLLAITQNDRKALILNYFIYQHHKGYDWVPAGAGSVKEGALLTCSRATVNRLTRELIEEGYFEVKDPLPNSWMRSKRLQLKVDFLLDKLIEAGFGKNEKRLKPNKKASLTVSDASINMSDGSITVIDGSLNMSDDLKTETKDLLNAEQKQECPAAAFENSLNTASGSEPSPSSAAPLPAVTVEEAEQIALGTLLAKQLLIEKGGIDEPVAADLAHRFDLRQIRDQLAALPYRLEAYKAKGREVYKPAGLLIRSIRENWEIPPGCVAASLPPATAPAAEQTQSQTDPWLEKLKSATAFVSEKGTRYLIRLIRESAQMVDFVLESDPNRPQSRPFSVLKQGGYVFE